MKSRAARVETEETGVRPAICDSRSLAAVVLLNDLEAIARESQIAGLTPLAASKPSLENRKSQA